MNSSLNGRLLSEGGFDGVFALPMASDRGIGLGAALHHVHATLKHPRFFTLETAFFGSATDDRAAHRSMKKAGLKVSRTDDPWGFAADALARGKIIGWMQGRSEMGARALGNRSILADPRRAETKDFVNARVKHREPFRPFAPAVLVDRAGEFFDIADRGADLSFMTFTLPTNGRAGSTIPATVHADNTARVQTVDAARHPDFARLISRFAEITGVPVVLNTSFNDKDEPIVETAEDAVATFLKTDMDALCIGHVIGVKP